MFLRNFFSPMFQRSYTDKIDYLPENKMMKNPSDPVLRVVDTGKDDLGWEVAESYHDDKSSILVHGNIASRMWDILTLYYHKTDRYGVRVIPDLSDLQGDPDCHGAGLYAAGVIDYIRRISPCMDFEEIYMMSSPEFTYEPQEPPVIVHLLNERLDTVSYDSFAELNTLHTVVYLGDIDGKKICFEKKGRMPAGFVTLSSTEKYYMGNETDKLYRLYVNNPILQVPSKPL